MTPEAGASSDGFWPTTSRIIPISKNTLLQNLYVARLAGAYAEVRKSINPALPSLNSFVKYEFRRTGVEDGGTYTVSLIPISTNINTVGTAKTYVAPSINEIKNDSIAINLQPGIAYNDVVKYVLQWKHNTGIEINDTIESIYADLDTLYYNDCSDISSFVKTGSWGINTIHYTSSGGSITESPVGDYTPNSYITIATSEWIDLTDAQFALLQFNAKWAIEDGYDFMEIYAEIEGGGKNNLCGKFTQLGSDNQNNSPAVYDGIQSSWVKEEINLSDYIGSRIKIKFEFSSDPYENLDGFYADDLTVLVGKDPQTSSVSNIPNNNITLAAFPNPANESINIQYQINNSKSAILNIVDVTGKTIYTTDINTSINNININTHNWASGIYFYQIKTEQGASITQKLVVQH